MTDRLRELLDPKRQKIDDDNVAAILTYDIVHEGQAVVRAAIVRQTLQEAAKLVCSFCNEDPPPTWVVENARLYHVVKGTKYWCDAEAIHALLASTGDKP